MRVLSAVLLALAVSSVARGETVAEENARLRAEVATLRAEVARLTRGTATATAPASRPSTAPAARPAPNSIAALFANLPPNLRPVDGENELKWRERVTWVDKAVPGRRLECVGVVESAGVSSEVPRTSNYEANIKVSSIDLWGVPFTADVRVFAPPTPAHKSLFLELKPGDTVQVTGTVSYAWLLPKTPKQSRITLRISNSTVTLAPAPTP